MNSQSVDDPLEGTDDEHEQDFTDQSDDRMETLVDTWELSEQCKLIVNNLKDYALVNDLNLLTSDHAIANLTKLYM